MTWLLDCRYIWIDSLCIMQYSEMGWLTESAVMGEVYAHSRLNIAATASADGDGGLFHYDTSPSRHPCIINIQHASEEDFRFVCYPRNIWKEQVEAAPLSKRGWVLQERLLSPRVVHFTSDQLFWDCCQEREAEFLPSDVFEGVHDLKRLAPISDVSADPTIQLENARLRRSKILNVDWPLVVAKYSACDLSFGKDELIAITGLASRVCRQLGGLSFGQEYLRDYGG